MNVNQLNQLSSRLVTVDYNLDSFNYYLELSKYDGESENIIQFNQGSPLFIDKASYQHILSILIGNYTNEKIELTEKIKVISNNTVLPPTT